MAEDGFELQGEGAAACTRCRRMMPPHTGLALHKFVSIHCHPCLTVENAPRHSAV